MIYISNSDNNNIMKIQGSLHLNSRGTYQRPHEMTILRKDLETTPKQQHMVEPKLS